MSFRASAASRGISVSFRAKAQSAEVEESQSVWIERPLGRDDLRFLDSLRSLGMTARQFLESLRFRGMTTCV